MREIKMGMTKEQFAETMDLLDGAFPRKSFMEEKVLNTWYKFFKRYDPDIFEAVVNEWILKNEKAPTIANLKPSMNREQVRKYRELEKEDDVKVNTYINSSDWVGK